MPIKSPYDVVVLFVDAGEEIGRRPLLTTTTEFLGLAVGVVVAEGEVGRSRLGTLGVLVFDSGA